MLEHALKKFLDDRDKIIIICIGNELRGDDGVGPLIAENLSRIFDEKDNTIIINAGTVPENYTGVIRKVQPSHIIFVDAVEMKMDPGSIRLVQKDEIANYSISTHAMPLSFMIKYLESFMNANMVLIGIQPKNMDMSNCISDEVKKSVAELTEIFARNL